MRLADCAADDKRHQPGGQASGKPATHEASPPKQRSLLGRRHPHSSLLRQSPIMTATVTPGQCSSHLRPSDATRSKIRAASNSRPPFCTTRCGFGSARVGVAPARTLLLHPVGSRFQIARRTSPSINEHREFRWV